MVSRRSFLGLLAGGAMAGCFTPPRAAPSADERGRIRAIAFDAFPIFDPRPVARLAEETVPGRGAALMEAWRARQFEYQWLRAVGGHYADFRETTRDALDFSIAKLDLPISAEARGRLIRAHDALPVWPDVPEALAALRSLGISLAFLSNMTADMIAANVARAGLAGAFDALLSTDAIRSYKPDPRAYRLGVDHLGVAQHEILFAAFAGWDAAGAKWFGYETFWVNRMEAPREQLGAIPDGTGRGLADLVAYVRARHG